MFVRLASQYYRQLYNVADYWCEVSLPASRKRVSARSSLAVAASIRRPLRFTELESPKGEFPRKENTKLKIRTMQNSLNCSGLLSKSFMNIALQSRQSDGEKYLREAVLPLLCLATRETARDLAHACPWT